MNLPADPEQRKRLAAAILQQTTSRNAYGLQHSTTIDEKDCEEEYDSSSNKRQYRNSNKQRHLTESVNNNNNNHALRLVGNNNPLPNGHQQRQWKQNTNLYVRQSKSKQLPNGHQTKLSNNNNNNLITGNGRPANTVIDRTRGLETNSKFSQNRTGRTNKVAPLCAAEGDGDLICEVRKRLSLPNDTLIPEGFLKKLNGKLISSVNNKRPEPLSRATRRQSLLDIGFGKLATYTKLHALGAGTYSIVYKGTSRLTNRLVALKEIHLEREEGVPFTAIREVSLLKQLKHNNIITLHDIIYADRTLTLVFEFVDRDLSHYMDECDHKINLNNIRLFLFQLLRGLKYCHDRKVLHRDLKPQNILISTHGELKLADFGLARARTFPTKTYTDEVVTLWYRPPDILLGNVNYGTDIDMWGVGCIFFEMVAGFTLFLGIEPKKQVGCIFEILGTPSELEWPNIKQDLELHAIDHPHYRGRELASVATRLDETGIDLLKRFLKCNPSLRISSNEALHHKYFSTFPPEIYDLHDSVSIFSLPALRLAPEEFARNASTSLQNVHV